MGIVVSIFNAASKPIVLGINGSPMDIFLSLPTPKQERLLCQNFHLSLPKSPTHDVECPCPFSNPEAFNQRITMTTPAMKARKHNQKAQQMQVRRDFFAFCRSSQESACLSEGRVAFGDEVWASSSRRTAMEKRRQKAGSRTVAMVGVYLVKRTLVVCVVCDQYMTIRKREVQFSGSSTKFNRGGFAE